MGIAKRSVEPEQDSADEPELEGGGEATARCALCGDRGLAAGFQNCTECKATFCKLTCSVSCAVCGVVALCEDCQTAKCPDCQAPVCSGCRLLADECAGCSGPLCGRDDCGGRCLSCGGLACRGCSVAVYDQRETQRQCLDCAVAAP
eukprot:CAMPEP_0204520336 /NCGR_PEP_ID=MMETSP0661-20131031/5212_1 /ASSEMBLY_ACC=CAM_ASM_000606 /TAXON_ID=109239 /ORGANISM="Alexandrium margalefi, Strain AMGDE01CS-322" /LENGTH=146 /DNA_ID=CAMNT_0051525887 /DNA_START=42 /DNA_END=478 /DNA_ORIENTATION=+